MTKIALIHAVRAAMDPIEAAFGLMWPTTVRMNLLDDSLSTDRASVDCLTPELVRRIKELADYALQTRVDAILFTCSAFGEAIDAVARTASIPVLKPNEAMFEAALGSGRRIAMLATFAPAVTSMEEEFRHLVRQRNASSTIETFVIPNAREALMAGDIREHDRLIEESAVRLANYDVIMLAHFSMATAEERVRARVTGSVLAAPSSAILKLRAMIEGHGV
jgi:Asp/Glu/hydantoin racemase